MNRENLVFCFEKYNFESIGNSVHTRECLTFGKDLLAILYLTIKVYITKILGVYSNFIWIFKFLRIPLTLKTYSY